MIRKFWLASLLLAVIGALILPANAQGRYHNDLDDYGRPYAPEGGQVNWSGNVDDTTIVYIHLHDVSTQTVSGKSATDVHARVFGRLSRGPVYVSLRQWDGRGRVRVIQEPSPDNDFTAAVRIRDPQPGRSHYDFVLGW